MIVNDGSDDDTEEIITKTAVRKNLRLINNPHMGKAQGLMTGVFQSKGEIILFADMDQATPIEEFDRLHHYLDQG